MLKMTLEKYFRRLKSLFSISKRKHITASSTQHTCSWNFHMAKRLFAFIIYKPHSSISESHERDACRLWEMKALKCACSRHRRGCSNLSVCTSNWRGENRMWVHSAEQLTCTFMQRKYTYKRASTVSASHDRFCCGYIRTLVVNVK